MATRVPWGDQVDRRCPQPHTHSGSTALPISGRVKRTMLERSASATNSPGPLGRPAVQPSNITLTFGTSGRSSTSTTRHSLSAPGVNWPVMV